MKIVILGAGNMLMNLIAGCMDAGCDIVGVFRADKVRYKGFDGFLLDLFNPSKELNYIKSHNLYEIQAKSANSAEFKKEILRLNADIVIVGTWGERLKKPIINLPKFATINVHPSLLPKFRGPNPYLQAIWHREKKSGVTFHLMDENFDTGAILLQKPVGIAPSDTGEELRHKITSIAREGVCELMQTLDKEIIVPVAQDEKRASYFPQIAEDEVMLDFSKPAEDVAAHIRAFCPWHKTYFAYNSHFFMPDAHKLEILDYPSPQPTSQSKDTQSFDFGRVARGEGVKHQPTPNDSEEEVSLVSHQPSPLAGEGVNNSASFLVPSPLAGEGEISARGTSARNLGEGLQVVEKSPKGKSITVVCGDGKLLKMQGVNLYGPLKFLTALYIKYRVLVQKIN